MSCNRNSGRVIIAVCLALLLVSTTTTYASDNFVRELMQSLSDMSASSGVDGASAPRDKVLASIMPSLDRPLQDEGESGNTASNPASVAKPQTVAKSGFDKNAPNDFLFPGATSVDIISDSLVKLASLSPAIDQTANSISVLDSHEKLGAFGKLASEPLSLYNHFLIEVDKAAFTVELSGFKDNGEKNLLYSCRAGLGSPEYPTPRGTFYIIRIFDDKPWWIPPQDREWAAGEVASRNVYGGHMMPLFSKYSALPNKRSELTLDDEDVVAAPIKMVDAGAYRIHGTNSPWSIGSGQSHGCVRLLNKTVAQLSDTLKMYVGTTTRGQTANGVYINLAKPVKMVLR